MGTLANLIGIAGFLSIILAYFLLQKGELFNTDIRYMWLNLGGALAIIFSLFWQWNLPAFLMETAWAAISANSIMKLKQKK